MEVCIFAILKFEGLKINILYATILHLKQLESFMLEDFVMSKFKGLQVHLFPVLKISIARFPPNLKKYFHNQFSSLDHFHEDTPPILKTRLFLKNTINNWPFRGNRKSSLSVDGVQRNLFLNLSMIACECPFLSEYGVG